VHGARSKKRQAVASRQPPQQPQQQTTFPDNAWTHVAVVHGGDGTAAIFLNGNLCAKGPVALPSMVPRAHYYVGRSLWGHDPYFKGEMRDVLVFNYALNRPELSRCALSRTFSSPGRDAPIMCLASSWREVQCPSALTLVAAAAPAWAADLAASEQELAASAEAPGPCAAPADWLGREQTGECPFAPPSSSSSTTEELPAAAAVAVGDENGAASSSSSGAAPSSDWCPRCPSPVPLRRDPSQAGLRRAGSHDHLFRYGGDADDGGAGGGGGSSGAAAAAPSETRLHASCSALCGCVLGCGGGLGAGCAALQFVPVLDAAQGRLASAQLRSCYPIHQRHLAALEAADEAAHGRAVDVRQRLDAARDAYRRAQSVERMVRMAERRRLPTDVRRDAATGQLVQPPRLAAALDAARGVFHAFAIYELRSPAADEGSGDGGEGGASQAGADGPWHVYVADVLNMRQLLPRQDCWHPNVASLLISVLRGKAGAAHEHATVDVQPVVTLKALNDSPELTTYYEDIGFTSKREAFATAGLQDTYRGGELLLGD